MGIGNTLATVTKAAFESLQEVMEQAFERGRKEGYSEGFDAGYIAAKNEIIAMVNGLGKSRKIERTENIPVTNKVIEQTEERAAPGTVKPMILNLLINYPEGLSKSQIVNMTGIKPNSVRGTLWSLNQEGHISKGGRDLWIPIKKQSSVDDHADVLG